TMLDRVLAQMVRADRLSAESVEEAREHAAKMGVPVIESLLAGGGLTDESLDDGIRAELEEDIYDIFFWREARFEFFEGQSPDAGPESEGVANERFFFSTDMLIMEAARRIDEWSYIQQRVSDPLEIHRHLNSNAGVMDMEGEVLQILELVDGKRNVGRLIEITGISPFHVYKGVATLIDQGVIEPVPSDNILPSAKECFREGRLQDAINLFEKAISDGVGIAEAHVLAAEAYAAIGEYELANYHSKCVAEFRIERGDLKEAISRLLKVLETIPTDLAARERIVELTAGRADLKTDDFDPLAAGKELVDLYLDIGELERVRSILEGLLLAHPEEIEFKKSLINVHSKAGDTKRVIELYESMADDLVTSRNPIEAIKYLQKIVMLDRSRKDISEKIKSLYQLDERRRSRHRSIVGLVFILCLIVAGAVGYVYYDRTAAHKWARLQGEVAAQVEKQEYEAALMLIDTFLRTYPYTMMGWEVKATRLDIEVKKSVYDEALKDGQLKNERKLRILRNLYKMAWGRYEQAFKQGNLPNALEDVESCRRNVLKANMPKDHAWWRGKHGELAITDLKNYMGQSAALNRRYRKAKDSGDWEKAREHALKLCEDYDLSSYARGIEVPVMLRSQPSGAQIHLKGRPLNVHTPAVIYCPLAPTVAFELRKPGFTATVLTVDPLKVKVATSTLSPTPRLVKFSVPALTGCGAAQGLVAVGLQGGKVGIAWLNHPSRQVVASLKGLSAVDGLPAVTAHRVIFRSNLGEIVCHSVVSGNQKWAVKTGGAAEFDLLVKNDRVFAVDRAGKLVCLRAVTGRELWNHQLDGLASGRPTPYGNTKLLIASQTGAVLILAVKNGEVLRNYPVKVGVSSRLLVADDVIVFGTTDGKVRAINGKTGAELWNKDAHRAVREEEIVMSPDGRWFYHLAGDDQPVKRDLHNWLVKRDLHKGTELKKVRLPGHLRFSPIVQRGTVYVVVRELIRGQKKSKYHDLLLTFDEENLRIQWWFKDGGDFRGPISSDGREVFVTGSNGKVYRFK
ncbi:MAG: PQQ-binding-like beta-propeller repeat protein, partial [Planctomycetota bacterium]